MQPLDDQQQAARDWFESLRDRICAAFEEIEREAGSDAAFTFTPWDRTDHSGEPGGGGVRGQMGGKVFEKVGVNVSTVWGEFSPELRNQIPGAEGDGGFWASGISLVAHLRSPHVPPAHMNTRHVRTTRTWFGGGADLNPIYPDEDDTGAFHARLRAACDAYAPDAYARFKRSADEYFFIPHRGEPRGVGGIFYDYLEGEFERHFAFTRNVGEAFLDIYPRLVRRHMDRPWTEAERQHQLVRRGRYAEFNLIYDRGTQFGLKTGGNPEAILMSLPPVVTWP